MAELNAAVIGLGIGGRHITAYREAGADVLAICDANEDILGQVGDVYGVGDRYTDFRELGVRDDIDVVSICTPCHLHADPAVTMMASGKHVLIEMPMATTFEDIQRITDTARRTNRKVMHGGQVAYSEAFDEIKRGVTSGEFGEIYYAEGDYIASRMDLLRGGWRQHLRSNYNVVADRGVVAVDVVQWIVDVAPMEVMSYGNGIAAKAEGLDVTDCIVSMIRFEGGCIAKSLVTMGAARPGFRNLQIYGTKKTYVTEPSPPGHLLSDAESRRWTHLEFKEDRRDARRSLIADLLWAIKTDTEPRASLVQAARTAGICTAAFESLKAGKPVMVPAF